MESKLTQLKVIQKDYANQAGHLEDTLQRCKRLTQAAYKLKLQNERAVERYTAAEKVSQVFALNNSKAEEQLTSQRYYIEQLRAEIRMQSNALEETRCQA